MEQKQNIFRIQKCRVYGLFLGILLAVMSAVFLSPAPTSALAPGDRWDFTTGAERTLVLPGTGTYKLEVWGAQGGSLGINYGGGPYQGGKGGYSVGAFTGNAGQTLYINVGGAGIAATAAQQNLAGGYNGGGSVTAGPYNHINASGGGATHIAARTGLLQNLSAYRSDVLIVAGGGGGGRDQPNHSAGANWAHGGAGGGLVGRGPTYHGSNLATEMQNVGGTQTSGSAFGAGLSLVGNSAGGGGWYGGISGGAGGGGSGYIGGVSTFRDITAQTIDGLAQFAAPSGATENGHAGSGYARITFIAASDNNKLSTLSATPGTMTPAFDAATLGYDLALTYEQHQITIAATPEDPLATVTGTGSFSVPAGPETFAITVTAPNGDVRVYIVNTNRPPSPYQYLSSVEIDGAPVPVFSPTTLEYSASLPYARDTINISPIPGHPGQTITGDTGAQPVPSGQSTKTIRVLSEDGSLEAIYTLTLNRAHSSYLKSLTASGLPIAPVFSPETLAYTAPAPAGTTVADLIATPYDEEATVTITRRSQLVTGNNYITITVSEPNSPPTTYTLNVVLAGDTSNNAYLSSLAASPGAFTPVFDPDTLEYDLALSSEDSQISISATPEHASAGVTGRGSFPVPVGDSTFPVTVTAPDGTIKIYEIHASRPASPYPYLSGISVNGIGIPNFDPETLEYEVTLTTYEEGDQILSAVKGRPGQTVDIPPAFTMSNGGTLTKEISVIPESGGDPLIYTLNFTKPHTNLLRSITPSVIETLRPAFDPYTSNYTLSVSRNTVHVPLNIVPYDSAATVTIEGGDYLAVGTNNITISVAAPDLPIKTYAIEITRRSSDTPIDARYDCTRGVQIFTAPRDDTYILEAWGAQGGSSSGFTGGKGGYSSGYYPLTEGQQLYIYVGCAGAGATRINQDLAGGYNGGGSVKGYQYNHMPGSGGGATHIAIADRGVLSAYNSFRGDVVIVAGGGGGSRNQSNHQVGARWANGGAGGGLSGLAPATYGATSISIPVIYPQLAGTQNSGNAFGLGGSASSQGGGGGGWYGGYSGDWQAAIGEIYGGAGAGGSGYVGASLLTNTSSIAGDTEMPSPLGGNMIGKSGNGYAAIRIPGSLSSDATLKSLAVSGPLPGPATTSPPHTENYPLNETFKPLDLAYTLPDLDPTITSLTLSATTNDPTTTISGTGPVTVAPGYNTFNITATAEDGTINIYTVSVSRPPSDVSTPLNITISGLSPSLCALDPDYCVLHVADLPASFSPDETLYALTIPNKISDLTFNVEKAHPNQSVSGDGPISIAVGVETVIITVTAENGDTTSYFFVVDRDLAIDADLASLSVDNAISPLSPSFAKDTTEYFVEVSSDTASLDLSYTLSDPAGATAEVLGNADFVMGLNDVIVRVTSAKGTTKDYIIHVAREANTNTYLSSLTVAGPDSTDYPVSPVFSKYFKTYTARVPNTVVSATISATAEFSSSTVWGDGDKNLAVGNNTFNLTVTAENGDTAIYQVNIIRAKNDNTRLSFLSALEGPLSPVFDPDTHDYEIAIDSSINILTLTATPEYAGTRYIISGNRNLQIGMSTITITTIAESGAIGTYRLTVQKSKSTNNYLSALSVTPGTLSPAFDKNLTNYTVSLPYEDASISINGTKEDPVSTVSGNGVYYLATGDTTIPITVTSATGETRTYTVTVTRATSQNTALIDILNDAGATLSPAFDNSISDYTLNVPYPTSEISFIALRADPTSTVTGTESRPLIPGDNPVDITVTAADGLTQNTFHINVVRDKSTDANLSSLFVAEGVISPAFDPYIIAYTVRIPYEYTALDIAAATEHLGATLEYLGNSDFVVGSNTVTVRVTAEAGPPYTKDYTITVIRQEEEAYSNHLSALDISEPPMSPLFARDTFLYDANVAYSTAQLGISATPEDPAATVSGTGTQSLSPGQNYLPIEVTSVDGKVRTYWVRAQRTPNNDSRLKTLTISNGSLNETFNPAETTYSLTTPYSALSLEYETMDPDATAFVLGNDSGFIVGQNTVTIVVVAADQVTSTEYTINVNRLPSNNNNLASLTTSVGTLSPTFNKAITAYNLSVANDINSILLSPIPEDPDATVSGGGAHTLNVGLNTLTIAVTSPAGITKSYVLFVTKAASDSNYLSSLTTSDGTLSPAFDKQTNDYTLSVPYDTTTLSLDGTLEDPTSVVSGFTSYNLPVGTTTIPITVVSGSGVANIYTVTVTREQINSPRLLSVSTPVVHFDFDPNVYEYTIDVPNEVTSLSDLTIVPEDPAATFAVSGNADFIVGMNTIEIDVTASDGVTTSTYTFHINRQLSANNYLLYLDTSEGTLSPAFDKTTMSYEVSVPNNITSITLSGEAESPTSTVSGLGVHLLETGDNDVSVTVRSATGVERTYHLTVTRAKSSDASLVSLTIGDDMGPLLLVPAFNPAITTYDITPRTRTDNVNISAIASSPLATVEGTGSSAISAGVNTIDITVTAEDNTTKVYTLHVTKVASTNAFLSSLIPSTGTLVPAFDRDTTAYVIDVDDTTPIISFSATPEDPKASVSGHGVTVLVGGANIINIAVTAEDGVTVKTYTVTVNQQRSNEARLSSLAVTDYPLSPAFSSDTYAYAITIPVDKTSLSPSEVIAAAIDPGATITKSPTLDFSTNLDAVLTKDFKVTVLAPDGFTTQEYTISVSRLPAFATLITSPSYTINRTDPDLEYVIGARPSTSLEDFLEGFDNPAEHLRVTNAAGDTVLSDPAALVGTGMKLNLTVGSTTYDTLTVIVRGDVTGEGLVDITDISRIRFYVVSKITLTNIELLAADVTSEGIVDITDISRIRFFVVNKLTGDGLNEEP